MRGTRRIPSRGRTPARFIPAYAGNAGARFIPAAGKQRTEERSRDARFIPAYAGNAPRPTDRYRTGTVHPRVCGERSETGQQLLIGNGSSPRMRGTLSCQCEMRSTSRGSSPRMRGTPHSWPCPHRNRRFIPAYAGNAGLRMGRWRGRTVHPRVCGERVRVMDNGEARYGSSPRMRGTREGPQWRVRLNRFIPAYAGNAFLKLLHRHLQRFIPAYAGNARKLAR